MFQASLKTQINSMHEIRTDLNQDVDLGSACMTNPLIILEPGQGAEGYVKPQPKARKKKKIKMIPKKRHDMSDSDTTDSLHSSGNTD